MRIVTVIGTRPQLIKAAALQPVLRARHTEVFVDTGQHWDAAMAGSFFAELGLARPDHTLGIGGGGHGEQTGRMLAALEPILIAERPDAVVVLGDTNSTLAGALAAAKLDIPVAHVEAGLRSFQRGMPEEINRIVADHLARWCFAPTPTAVANLAAEGIVDGVFLVGDLMHDLLATMGDEVRDPSVLLPISRSIGIDLQPGRYIFGTLHRAENRKPAALRAWVELVATASRLDRPVIVALHPGTREALEAERIHLPPTVVVVEPLTYRSALALQLHAAAVLTDSGGIQRESSWLGTPCLVLRSTSEWTETIAASSGRTAVVSLDVERAMVELDRVAPQSGAPEAARRRSAELAIVSGGAASAIVDGLRLEGRA